MKRRNKKNVSAEEFIRTYLTNDCDAERTSQALGGVGAGNVRSRVKRYRKAGIKLREDKPKRNILDIDALNQLIKNF